MTVYDNICHELVHTNLQVLLMYRYHAMRNCVGMLFAVEEELCRSLADPFVTRAFAAIVNKKLSELLGAVPAPRELLIEKLWGVGNDS